MPGEVGAWRIERHATIGSTNVEAQARLGNPGAGGTVIVADEQTFGEGRHGRRWIAEPGTGLLFTAILPVPVPTSAAWVVPLWAGLAAAQALQDEFEVATTLQWPNDLLLDERKLGGILCVSRVVGRQSWIGVGIGVNVHRPQSRRAWAEIVPPPIALEEVVAAGEDARPRLLAAILARIEDDLAALDAPANVARRWERRSGLPRAYRFAFDDGARLEGSALRIATGGGLVVRTAEGERTIELAAEARVVRG